MENSEFSEPCIAAATLPQSPALPLEVMAAAIAELRSNAAVLVDGEPLLTQEAADAYSRVATTDFTKESWQLDCEDDRATIALWVGLGGSFIADFAAAADQPRIFAWVLSPVPAAAQFALKELKGRDGRWVPTSLLATEQEFLTWLEGKHEPINAAAISAVLDCGPVGLRFRALDDALPGYFMLREFDCFRAQAVLPGRSPHWERWLEQYTQLTGHRFAGITSANLSDLGREVRSGGTHKDLAEAQVDMGFLNVPILSGPISIDGQEVPLAERAAGYKALNRPYSELTEESREHSTAVAPISTSLLGFTPDAGTWELLRHGSLHETVLSACLARHGITLDNCTKHRLELSRYVGDLVAAFPLFSELESRQIAEISQLIEMLPFTAGDVIVREGDKAEKIFFIATGSVIAEKGGGIELTAGSFFGEISLIKGIPRTATVRGHRPGVLLALDSHILYRLMEFLPEMAGSIREMAIERLSRSPE